MGKEVNIWPWVTLSIMIIILIIAIFAEWPLYSVYSRTQHGKAQLKEAEYNRQIKVVEAQAKLESERLNKQSEIVRSEGVAQANQIVSGSITDQYIRYLWVKTLEDNNHQIIYVPTEAQLPITEAPRLSPTTQTSPLKK